MICFGRWHPGSMLWPDINTIAWLDINASCAQEGFFFTVLPSGSASKDSDSSPQRPRRSSSPCPAAGEFTRE